MRVQESRVAFYSEKWGEERDYTNRGCVEAESGLACQATVCFPPSRPSDCLSLSRSSLLRRGSISLCPVVPIHVSLATALFSLFKRSTTTGQGTPSRRQFIGHPITGADPDTIHACNFTESRDRLAWYESGHAKINANPLWEIAGWGSRMIATANDSSSIIRRDDRLRTLGNEGLRRIFGDVYPGLLPAKWIFSLVWRFRFYVSCLGGLVACRLRTLAQVLDFRECFVGSKSKRKSECLVEKFVRFGIT